MADVAGGKGLGLVRRGEGCGVRVYLADVAGGKGLGIVHGDSYGVRVNGYVCVRGRRQTVRIRARWRGTCVYAAGGTALGPGRGDGVRVCTWPQAQG